MLYSSAQDYLNAPHKSVALFGMSGLGKTRLAYQLYDSKNWFHYSVDYRIGTHYMYEPIADNLKLMLMKTEDPLLRDLLITDSIHITPHLSFHNLGALSVYLGKPGDPKKGGIPFEEYQRRQDEHLKAEIGAMKDMARFQKRAQNIYGYDHFVTDCSGSLCEILGDDIASSALMKDIAAHALPVWIKGPKSHKDTLVARFKKAPKPMYYRADFLAQKWQEYLETKSVAADAVDPDDFAIWGYEALIEDRMPRYQAMAEHWGVTITSEEVEAVHSPEDFNELIASKL